ncbi:T9SS type A sorting domain-containing protein [Hymenobacter monticola]|uniref:T9SS type A sorting domain-containing protein n=1 Tax=Hymenobacter monticola TaxID=1705399 RepID=A0ABY4B868_9BACT|nr:T9SS type A sorting domain-containing protein [Hymenobacter monticola]UOE34934.1 T9SS type A sorting domain-containing protein [Hymenobacter monticola]
MRHFVFLLLLLSQQAYAQNVTAYKILPANASANDNLKLVLTVAHGGCGGYFSYSVTRSGNALAVRGCYPAVVIAMPCVTSDTVQLGRLPAGTYSVSAASYIAQTASDCPGTAVVAPGPPNATGSFTVGLALASRAATPAWTLSPTVVPATATALALSGEAAWQQVAIYDVSGRQLARYAAPALPVLNGSPQVPVLSLAPALYLLRVTDQSGLTSTRRFVRQ